MEQLFGIFSQEEAVPQLIQINPEPHSSEPECHVFIGSTHEWEKDGDDVDGVDEV